MDGQNDERYEINQKLVDLVNRRINFEAYLAVRDIYFFVRRKLCPSNSYYFVKTLSIYIFSLSPGKLNLRLF